MMFHLLMHLLCRPWQKDDNLSTLQSPAVIGGVTAAAARVGCVELTWCMKAGDVQLRLHAPESAIYLLRITDNGI